MRRLIMILNCIVLLFTLSSCDYKDIDRRMFIVTVGIDYISEDEIEITAKGAVAQSEQLKVEEKYTVYTVTDNNLANAFRKLKARVAYEPDYSHMKNLIIGEGFSKKVDLKQTIDFFINRRDFQNLMYVIVGLGGAKALVEAAPEGEMVAGSDIFLSFGQGSESVYSHRIILKDMFETERTPGITSSTPIIRRGEDDIVIDQVALFDNGNKLKLVLKDEETKIFNIIYHKLEEGAITAYVEKTKERIGADIISLKRKINITKDTDGYTADIDFKIVTRMEQKPSNEMDRKAITELLQNSFKGQVEMLLKKLQDAKIDPLKLQMYYWEKNMDYELSDDWLKNAIPNMKFKVNVDIETNSQGIIK